MAFRDAVVRPLPASYRATAIALTPIVTAPHLTASEPELDAIDLNTATRDQLTQFKGIGLMYADRIIRGRPYQARSELVSRRIVPVSLWLNIRHRLEVVPTPPPPTPAALEPDLGLLDINHATADQLRSFTGVGQWWTDRIIKGRPYKAAIELVGRRIMPLSAYERIQDKIVARPD